MKLDGKEHQYHCIVYDVHGAYGFRTFRLVLYQVLAIFPEKCVCICLYACLFIQTNFEKFAFCQNQLAFFAKIMKMVTVFAPKSTMKSPNALRSSKGTGNTQEHITRQRRNVESKEDKMVVLKNIPRILSPELLSVLARMGHGDEIVLADANFPSASVAKAGPELVSIP